MTTALATIDSADALAAPQADSDETLIRLWLHGRSEHTQRAYGRDVRTFLEWVEKALAVVTLEELQRYSDKLAADDVAPATRVRALSAIKSVFAFGHRIGYLRFDVGRALRLPKLKSTLAERIISERQALRLIGERSDDETRQDRRDRVIVELLYAAGLRVSELCGLKWRDVQERAQGGQVTVYGKGEKTRAVVLPPAPWSDLIGLRGDAADDAPVFTSRKGGGHLCAFHVNRIVKAQAKRAGVRGEISPHYLRHSHATHSLENGAPIHLVSATLGHASISTTGKYLHARPSESSSRFLKL